MQLPSQHHRCRPTMTAVLLVLLGVWVFMHQLGQHPSPFPDFNATASFSSPLKKKETSDTEPSMAVDASVASTHKGGFTMWDDVILGVFMGVGYGLGCAYCPSNASIPMFVVCAGTLIIGSRRQVTWWSTVRFMLLQELKCCFLYDFISREKFNDPFPHLLSDTGAFLMVSLFFSSLFLFFFKLMSLYYRYGCSQTAMAFVVHLPILFRIFYVLAAISGNVRLFIKKVKAIDEHLGKMIVVAASWIFLIISLVMLVENTVIMLSEKDQRCYLADHQRTLAGLVVVTLLAAISPRYVRFEYARGFITILFFAIVCTTAWLTSKSEGPSVK
ncbi:MAG: hypothetical protein ACPGC9_01135 [Cytophagales bacterium]